MKDTAAVRLQSFIILVVAICLFSGCDLYGKEKKQEVKIIGRVEGYSSKVEKAQKALRESGFDPGPLDGKLGWQTRKAIRELQKANKLKATGFIDIETWGKLYGEEITPEVIKERLAQAEWVRKIQEALRNAGFDPGPIDGKLGSKTKRAIEKFQEANGCRPDGIIDSETWIKLNDYFPKSESR